MKRDIFKTEIVFLAKFQKLFLQFMYDALQ